MTDVSELIERVARKLAMFMFDTYGDAPGVVWAGLDVYQREKAFKAARAAIEASGVQSLSERNAVLEGALRPFAAMGRVMEARMRVTFGKVVPDGEIVCASSGEAGEGYLVMGHFRDAAVLLPNAPGWGGMYQPPFSRDALTKEGIENAQ